MVAAEVVAEGAAAGLVRVAQQAGQASHLSVLPRALLSMDARCRRQMAGWGARAERGKQGSKVGTREEPPVTDARGVPAGTVERAAAVAAERAVARSTSRTRGRSLRRIRRR